MIAGKIEALTLSNSQHSHNIEVLAKLKAIDRKLFRLLTS